jgi:hypothetical protein
MNRIFELRWLMVIGLLLSMKAQASISLGFTSATQIANRLEIGLQVSGLGDLTAPALSTYDLDIHFDPSVLNYSGITFGDPLLGNQLDVFNLADNTTTAELSGVGRVNVFELSLDTTEDLNDWQADSFILATLNFDILNHGSSALTIHVNVFDDTEAAALSPSVQSATITTVPLPSALLLFLAGFGVIGRKWWRSWSM